MSEFLQSEERAGGVFKEDEYDGRALLGGFVVVSEWIDQEGNRWLSRLHGSGDGSRTLPEWQVQGYLHNALHHGHAFDGEGEDF